MPDATPKERGPRSPGYPNISLELALERTAKLKEYSPGRKPIPVDTALAQWKYSSQSGAGLQQLASLKKFGLLSDIGKKDQRAVQLTDLAWKILTDPRPDSPERMAALQEAALLPKIHFEIRDRWPHGLPDDTTMQVWLVQEKKFNEGVIKGLLSQIRVTFEYAKLDSELKIGHDNGDEKSKPNITDFSHMFGQMFKPTKRTETPSQEPRMKREASTIGQGEATIQWPVTRTKAEWEDLDYWLKGILNKAKRDVHQDPTQGKASNEPAIDEPVKE